MTQRMFLLRVIFVIKIEFLHLKVKKKKIQVSTMDQEKEGAGINDGRGEGRNPRRNDMHTFSGRLLSKDCVPLMCFNY